MSSDVFAPVIIPENIIRDTLITVVNAGNYAFDFGNAGIIGLDLFLNNQGAAAITISFNGGAAITVPAGAAFAITGTKLWLIVIVAAVNYDLLLSGVKYSTLQAKGMA